MALSETWVQFVMAATLPCSTDQASIQAAALPGTDGCLASPRVPAGLDMACAGGGGAALEVVRPGSSMSGRQRRQQWQQQQQPASGVGRRSGVKNYECDECGKKFTTISRLNEHAFRHTGVREFECDVCGKCFKTKGDIARHVKIHF
ncbi:putative zinc finger protein 840 [Scylla paramamosain]|uniref:putative zinc finger protein 840 n=1 Tax=Scylla paramamosain TaxID=85552 RepID=UPI003083991C